MGPSTEKLAPMSSRRRNRALKKKKKKHQLNSISFTTLSLYIRGDFTLYNISDKLNTPEKPWEKKTKNTQCLLFLTTRHPVLLLKAAKWNGSEATWVLRPGDQPGAVYRKRPFRKNERMAQWISLKRDHVFFEDIFDIPLNQSINFRGDMWVPPFLVPDLYDDYRKILRNKWPGCERGQVRWFILVLFCLSSRPEWAITTPLPKTNSKSPEIDLLPRKKEARSSWSHPFSGANC